MIDDRVKDWRIPAFLQQFRITEQVAKNMAYDLEKKYGGKTFLMIQETPHMLVFHGIEFSAIETPERIRRSDVYQYEPTRIHALVYTAYSYFECAGHTKVSLQDLIRMCNRIERNCGVFENTPPLILGRCIKDNYKVVGLEIYSKHLYYAEQHIAKALKKLNKKTNFSVSENMITDIENELQITYDETQKDAFNMLSNRLSILTGGPGTGKTTVLKGIISAWRRLSDLPIICCAPTGKAAERMRDATGLKAETIHRTLGIRPYQRGGYDAQVELPECLLIVDEVSMLDTDLADVLLSSVITSKSQLILVGDEEQLQSVGPGAVLRDIIDCGKFLTIRLGTIHRQDAGAIIDNAYNIKTGRIGFKCDDSFLEKRYFDDEELVKNVIGIHKKMHIENEPLAIRIFTPVRSDKYITSTFEINSRLHRLYHAGEPELQIGKQAFSVGDPVVITKNDYENGVLNGDEGIVEDIVDGLGVRINNEYHYLTGEILNYVELGYAVTIHKAQGSSCKLAIIVIPDRPRVMLTRRLLYVAVTRAEKKCIILHEAEGLEMSIRNDNEFVRKTGLLEKLGVKKNVSESIGRAS